MRLTAKEKLQPSVHFGTIADIALRCDNSHDDCPLLHTHSLPLMPLATDERRLVLAQLARYVLIGVLVTALGVSVYSVAALLLRWNPQIGNFLAYVVTVTSGYLMHSKWSFQGHGAERTHITKVRFAIISVISYALNSFWVWLFYTRLDLGAVAPILPMVFVTPALAFALNRQWVFR
jgi:putative flippase GtrA